MNKSILIIDTPETCGGCPLKYFDTGDDPYFGNNTYRCVIDNIEVNGSTKDYFCPLKPLPKRVGSASEYGSDEVYIKHLINWKKEIDDIFGEEE